MGYTSGEYMKEAIKKLKKAGFQKGDRITPEIIQMVWNNPKYRKR